MRLIDAEPIIEMLKRVRQDADSPRRDLDLLNLQQLLEFAPEIAPPPNAPLTLDELREMDGEPVWDSVLAQYGYVDSGCNYIRYINDWWNPRVMVNNRFYRRKPEEGTT